MPHVVWSRTFAGGFASSKVGDELVYLHYNRGDGQPDPTASELVCLDAQGQTLWTRPSLSPVAALPERKLLLKDTTGAPLVVDDRGEVGARWVKGTVDSVFWVNGTIVVSDGGSIHLADPDLRVRRAYSRPAAYGSCPALVGDSIYWAADNRLMALTPERGFETILELPATEIVAAGARREARTGKPAIFGHLSLGVKDGVVVTVMPENVPGSEWKAAWQVSLDPERHLAFLTSMNPPHVVACVGLSGSLHWIEVMNGACCGGSVHPLPSGNYVVNESCGGLVLWFDREGRVLHESEQHEGLSGEVDLLPGGVVVASDFHGVVAYGPEMSRIWSFDTAYTWVEFNPKGTAFVGTSWSTTEDGARTTTVELVTLD